MVNTSGTATYTSSHPLWPVIRGNFGLMGIVSDITFRMDSNFENPYGERCAALPSCDCSRCLCSGACSTLSAFWYCDKDLHITSSLTHGSQHGTVHHSAEQLLRCCPPQRSWFSSVSRLFCFVCCAVQVHNDFSMCMGDLFGAMDEEHCTHLKVKPGSRLWDAYSAALGSSRGTASGRACMCESLHLLRVNPETAAGRAQLLCLQLFLGCLLCCGEHRLQSHTLRLVVVMYMIDAYALGVLRT